MAWFRVDDVLADHPKVIMAGNAAMGLWVRAGAWSMKHLTDGFVPTAAVAVLGSPREAKALVSVGLWLEVEGGFKFHAWEGRQPTKDEVEDRRAKRAEAGRKGGLKSGQSRREAKNEANGEANASGVASHADEANANPVPSPLTQVSRSPSVLETGASFPQGTDEGDSVEALCVRQAAALKVDFGKVKTAIGKACGRFPAPTAVMQVIATVLERATPPVKSPTGLVLRAVENDWPEWQKLIDESEVA